MIERDRRVAASRDTVRPRRGRILGGAFLAAIALAALISGCSNNGGGGSTPTPSLAVPMPSSGHGAS